MTIRYQHHRDRQEALRVRLRELAGSRVRYGYRRLTVLLRSEGWQVNAKQIYRLYTEEGLIVRTRKRPERALRQRLPLGQAMLRKFRHFCSSKLVLDKAPRISHLTKKANCNHWLSYKLRPDSLVSRVVSSVNAVGR